MPELEIIKKGFKVGDVVRPTNLACKRRCFDSGEKFVVTGCTLKERPNFCLVTTRRLVGPDMIADQLLFLEGKSAVFPGITSGEIWASFFQLA